MLDCSMRHPPPELNLAVGNQLGGSMEEGEQGMLKGKCWGIWGIWLLLVSLYWNFAGTIFGPRKRASDRCSGALCFFVYSLSEGSLLAGSQRRAAPCWPKS